MWKKPYSMREGSTIVVGLIIVGMMLQLSIGPVGWDIFLWPANIITLIVLIAILIAIYITRQKIYFCRFIPTKQAAVPAIAAACLLTVIMGLTSQVSATHAPAEPIGISKMLSFWPFILVYVWMTMIVGEVAIEQTTHFSLQRLPALLSHIGLFIVLACGTLGSADMQRLRMYCEQGKPEWRGLDAWNNVHELPVAIQLDKFTIDEYPPKLLLIDSNGSPIPAKKPQTLLIDSTFSSGQLQGWTVTVKKRIDNGIPQNGNTRAYTSSKMPGAACALLVRLTKAGKAYEGWVTSGSYLFSWQGLHIDNGRTLVMGQREPKRYSSKVEVYTKDGKSLQADIEVNHPVTVNGWKIYQYSYNEQMGKWSTLSIFELVRDPWLPVVYFGILLLALGAIGMIFTNHKSLSSNK